MCNHVTCRILRALHRLLPVSRKRHDELMLRYFKARVELEMWRVIATQGQSKMPEHLRN